MFKKLLACTVVFVGIGFSAIMFAAVGSPTGSSESKKIAGAQKSACAYQWLLSSDELQVMEVFPDCTKRRSRWVNKGWQVEETLAAHMPIPEEFLKKADAPEEVPVDDVG